MNTILDLCGGTGSWSKPYLDNGYCVHNITLPSYDVMTARFKNGWLFVNGKDGELSINTEDVVGILAAPPCTMFSLARTNAKEERNFYHAMSIVRTCLDVVWGCRMYGPLKFWALENPVGYLSQFLGKPAFKFQPYEFGDMWYKRTCLWGYFKEPKKKKIKLSEEEEFLLKNKSRVNFDLPSISDISGKDRQEKRAITPPGFAKAFFKANQ